MTVMNEHTPASADASLAVSQAIKGIASIVSIMTMVFTLLEILLPSSFVQPVGALICGLAVTIFLVWWYKWNLATLLTASLAFGLLLVILHLIVTRPAVVTGGIVDSQQQPQAGVSLTLTDVSGVAHSAISDTAGLFTISNVPEGAFVLQSDGELLFMGQVCSGWRRLLSSGQDLGTFAYRNVAPVTPVPTPLPTQEPPTPEPATPLPTQEPPLTPGVSPVQIVDIDYAPAASPLDEAVILRNVTDTPLDMTGWQLEDKQGHVFPFPSFTLDAGARVTIWTKEGENSRADLFWNIRTSVWNDDVSDTATLRNAVGDVVTTYTYTP
ncbi:MAG: lamin tail domain-containing protein [Anaerolineales bacterium]|nr:lamin tail domain-containing protein [Anaerolineales bacterium]MCB8953320.1 lamin tail domain-containing protein [Ardenticatenales bacterium]